MHFPEASSLPPTTQALFILFFVFVTTNQHPPLHHSAIHIHAHNTRTVTHSLALTFARDERCRATFC